MMTKLCEMIMECLAIKGMDRLVLYGWAAQLEEANDTVYASKETVADFIGVSTDTVLRRTQALVKSGWLIETGEQKQWEFARTPVRIINVPVIVGLVEAQRLREEKALPHFAVLPQTPPQKAPPHFAAQGSSGSRFIGLDVLSSSSAFSATGVPPVAVSTSKEVEQTENREPRTVEPKPKPTPHGQRKSCPECGEPFQRDVNHFLTCRYAKGRSELDEYLGDMLPRPSQDSMGEKIEFEEWDDEDGMPLFPLGQKPNGRKAEEARQRVDAERQEEIESILAEGRARTTAAPFAHSPGSAVPPQAQAGGAKRCAGCGGREPCRDKWCYAYEPLPKCGDEILPTGINP